MWLAPVKGIVPDVGYPIDWCAWFWPVMKVNTVPVSSEVQAKRLCVV